MQVDERCGISNNRNLGNPTLRETSDWPRSRQMACRGSYRDPANLPLGSIHPATAYETIRAREDQIKKYPATPQPVFGMEGTGSAVNHVDKKILRRGEEPCENKKDRLDTEVIFKDTAKFISSDRLRGMDRPIVERTLRGLEMQGYGSDGREVRGNYFQEQAPTMYGGSSAYAQPGDRPNVVFPAPDKRVIPFRGKSFPIPGKRNPMPMPPHHMGQTGGGGDPGRGVAGAPLPPAPFKAQKPGVRFVEEFIQRRRKAPRGAKRRDSKRNFTRKEPETASDLHARKAIEGIETSDGSDDYHLAARAAAQGLMKLMSKKK